MTGGFVFGPPAPACPRCGAPAKLRLYDGVYEGNCLVHGTFVAPPRCPSAAELAEMGPAEGRVRNKRPSASSLVKKSAGGSEGFCPECYGWPLQKSWGHDALCSLRHEGKALVGVKLL